MAQPHVIRLRGPWELTPLRKLAPTGDGHYETQTDDLPPGGKTPVPGDWSGHLGDAFWGTVRYLRRFNSPTNLDLGERVWLVCEAIDPRGAATLNDQPIFAGQDPAGPWSQDITDLLRAHNRLVIDIEMVPADLEPIGEPPGKRGQSPFFPAAGSSQRADRCGRAGGLPGEVRLEIRRDE